MRSVIDKEIRGLLEKRNGLGEVFTWLCCIDKKQIPKWKIAQKGGYKRRQIHNHLKDLQRRGLLIWFWRFKDHRQQPNCYYLPELIAPLSHDAFRGVGNLILSLPYTPWGGGAMRRGRLLKRVMQLVGEIAHRFKTDETALFLEVARLLRRKEGGLGAVVGALEEAKDFFWERGGKPPDNPAAFLTWALV